MSRPDQALYLVRAENGLTKIGIAVSPLRRLVTLRADSPLPLELVHMAAVDDAAAIEAALHTEFAAIRTWGRSESDTPPAPSPSLRGDTQFCSDSPPKRRQ